MVKLKTVAVCSFVGIVVTGISVYLITPPPRGCMLANRMGLGVSMSGMPKELRLVPESENSEQSAAPSVLPVAEASSALADKRPPITVAETRTPPPPVQPSPAPPSRGQSARSSLPQTPTPIRFTVTGPNGFAIQGTIPMTTIPLPPIVFPAIPGLIPQPRAAQAP